MHYNLFYITYSLDYKDVRFADLLRSAALAVLLTTLALVPLVTGAQSTVVPTSLGHPVSFWPRYAPAVADGGGGAGACAIAWAHGAT